LQGDASASQTPYFTPSGASHAHLELTYVGPTPYVGFNPIFFVGSMHAMATDAHQAFVTAPRASSTGSGFGGGGFGGGGFSGGGFGGGGGGAF